MFKTKIGFIILSLIFLFDPEFLSGQEDFVWVGGSGNWSDTLHWSSTGGGLPSQIDNVFFNSNSFSAPNQIVVFDGNPVCNNMDWSNASYNPGITGSADLNIHGSLILTTGMTMDYTGDIYFNSSSFGNVVNLNGNVLNSDVYFEGTGVWTLLNSLNIDDRNIYLIKGTLVSDGYLISCGSFFSTSPDTKILNLGSSNVKIQSFNGKWQVNNNLMLIKGTSTIIFNHPDFTSENIFEGGGLEYCNVVFRNNAVIKDGNSFENLYLSAQQYYELESGKTQTITENIFARGCSGLIDIRASENDFANIACNNININISFVTLNHINAITSGGYQFNAWHSVDLGNNQGVTIYPESRDMFWINNTGNWSDTTHWTSSPVNEDSDCIPIIHDNVFFNDNSFENDDTVYVNLEEANCNNMIWSGTDTPVFRNTISNTELNIHGSLEFSSLMKNSFNGPVFFRDSLMGKTIKTANKVFLNNIYFVGSNGEWTIEDSLIIIGSIIFNKGTLNTNDNYISCMTFHSESYPDSAFARTLNFGSSEINVINNSGYAWSVNNENLELNAGTSTIKLVPNGATMKNYGGDTIEYYNVIYTGIRAEAKHNTFSDTYGIFHKVTFNSNAMIYGSNSFDTLSFSPGNYYQFNTGSTQTINNEIYPSGTCNGPILLKTNSITGATANLKKLNDTLRLEYTAIRDINAVGNGIFIAENSVDLGNNSGWDTITVSAPGTLYWVNGAGNWNDNMHWDTISGGPGGICIPTPFDVVIFDQNSFNDTDQYVKINLNNAFAHDMYWTDANFIPEFSGNYSGAYLRIFGSLELNADMDFTFPGYIYFESVDNNETITTCGVKFHNVNNDVYFTGNGGEWTLIDTLDLGFSVSNKNSVFYNNGKLNTNNQTVKCYNFNSNIDTDRELVLGNSDIHILNNLVVNGTNLNLVENNSLIEIDSGMFSHINGNYFPYNNVNFTSAANSQELFTNKADSVLFNNVTFNSVGKVYGAEGSVYAHKVAFSDVGRINSNYSATVNVYSIDSLFFDSDGYLYGDDTAGMVRFASNGLIEGNGEYKDVLFLGDGEILKDNLFDTLTFSPGHYYQLESQSVQTIVDSFDIVGNNCESIYLQATAGTLAEVYKESGSVYGDFIEMQNIMATGDATFDAGYFSTDINGSNEGWIFHESPLNYSLGSDTSILEGDTIYLCADNFNGNSGTSYTWISNLTGNVVSTDSCLMVTERGYYSLIVDYTDGPGCTKIDTIFVGCYLDLEFDNTQISCNGYNDGSIEMEILIGVEPFMINWYNDGVLVDTTQNIYDLYAGTYMLEIEDGENCVSYGEFELTEPDTFKLDYYAHDACYGEDNGIISLNVTGGTEPYIYSWSNDSTIATMSGLSAGTYDVTVDDAHNCPTVIPKNTLAHGNYEIEFDIEVSDLLCYHDNSGSVDVINLTGGTGNYVDYLWYKNDAVYANSQNLDTLPAGEYELSIMDDYGCNFSKNIVITEPDELILHLEGINGNISLGAIDLTVNGGTLPYSYLWSTGETTEDVDPLGGGVYTVEVTDDNLCKSSASIFVEVHYRIYAPTAFSPNGDNINDEFHVFGLGTDLREFELTIFNRWGQIVFNSNDVNDYWNGKLNNTGEILPVDVYTWQAVISYSTGEKITDNGNVSLLR